MEVAMGYSAVSDWRIDWAATATFAAAFVALLVGLIPGRQAAKAKRDERRDAAAFVHTICNPAEREVMGAVRANDLGLPPDEKILIALREIEKAERELIRFDFLWKSLSPIQASLLLGVEEHFRSLSDDFKTILNPVASPRSFELASNWEGETRPKSLALSACLGQILQQSRQ